MDGHENSPRAAVVFPGLGLVGEGRDPLAGGGVGEADAVAFGDHEVGVVHEAVHEGGGDSWVHELIEATWNWHTFDSAD